VVDSIPGELFRRWLQNSFELVLSEHILLELARTLEKPYFQHPITAEQVERATRAFRKRGRMIPITAEVVGVATHSADDLVVATAVSAGIDFVVTGDRGLLAVGRFRGVRIVTPRTFLDVLDRASGRPR